MTRFSTLSSPPRLVQRPQGDWLALSRDEEQVKIGVRGASYDEAASNYASAIQIWHEMLDLEVAASTGRSTRSANATWDGTSMSSPSAGTRGL